MKKWIIVTLIVIVLGGVGTALYMFFMPHRDVQKVEAFAEISAADFVHEYLADPASANDKYLDEEGESKVIIVTGLISSISKDQNNQFVIVLKDPNEKLGVSCTFMASTNNQAASLKVGNPVKIKGVIRSGAEHDPDLDLDTDAILEKCAVVN